MFKVAYSPSDSQYGYSSSQYGSGYMQTNPSYNINSGGGTSKYSNYSTGAYHDHTGGMYGSTGSRHQYGDVGGYQTAYYQRYQDGAGMLLSMLSVYTLWVYINCMYLHTGRNVVLYDRKLATCMRNFFRGVIQ